MKVSSPGGMNLDVHAAWTRHTDTPYGHAGGALQTRCRHTEDTVQPHRSTLGAEPASQNPPRRTHSEETAKKHTHQ